MNDPPLLVLNASWTAIEAALALIAESSSELPMTDDVARLRGLGLVDPAADPPVLTHAGERYYMARFVREDAADARAALAAILKDHPVPSAFCAALWGSGRRPVSGALRMIRQLTKSGNDIENRRWLALMNAAGLIAYNQKNPTLRVLFNPTELAPAQESEARERTAGHVVSPDRPYSNLLALRSVLRAARDFIWWYEQHMPGKVLEVLVAELDGSKVSDVRILSGPANVTEGLKSEFARFSEEMKRTRGIDVQWRVLGKGDAFKVHDRILVSKDFAKNLPPVNTILAGSVGEILPSEIKRSDFDTWWKQGTDLASFVLTVSAAS